MGAGQHHGRANSLPGGLGGFPGFVPAQGAQAPSVAGFQTGETVFGAGGAEVVTPAAGEVQERLGHDGADHVPPGILIVGAAKTIAIKPRYRAGAATAKRLAENV